MITRLMAADEAGTVSAATAEAAAHLSRGEIVGVPTETVYGLACDAMSTRAASKVFSAKERPAFDPLIVHVEDGSWVGRLSSAEDEVLVLAEKLAAAFWPGPLTMVLPSREVVPDLLRSGLPTVALRCSAHRVMASLLASFGGPVAAPSANRFGRISPVTAKDVLDELEGRIPLVLDGGRCRHGLESTIVAVKKEGLVLLRPGPVTPEELREFAPVDRPAEGEVVAAPGMLASHYAPRTPMRILPADEPSPDDSWSSGLLSFGPASSGFAQTEILPEDPLEAAPLFFSALRRLDASGVQRIYARPIAESGLGIAIMDRLGRASHG